jgi:spore germination protein YaaH
MAAYLYVSDEYDETGTFTETLLLDETSQNLIFTSILQENSAVGFDGANHDFQMIVAENGHNGDEATTTYYFYVEIQ